MSRPWLRINGQDVRQYGLTVLDVPPVQAPAKNIEHIHVPGRSGTLTRWRGDYLTMTIRPRLKYTGHGVGLYAAMEALQNATEIEMSTDPDMIYAVSCNQPLIPDRVIADRMVIEPVYIAQPDKWPKEV